MNEPIPEIEREKHKHTEEMLRVRELAFSLIADNVPGLIDYIDLEGRILYANKLHEEWFGVPLSEIVGKHYSQAYPSAASERIEHGMELLRAGKAVQYEAPHPWARPTPRWVFANYVPDLDGQGKLKGFFLWGIDITERKRLEEQLRESEAKLQHAQELANIGYWERDLSADRITLSEETCKIFKLELPNGFLSQAELEALIHPDDRQPQRRALSQALQGSRFFEVEFRVVRTDGDIRFVHVRDDIIYDESGKPIRMFGAVQDITERKQAEEQIRQHAARMQALAEMSRALAECGLDYQRVLDTIAQRTAKLIGDLCIIALYSEGKQRAVAVAFRNPDPKSRAWVHHTFFHVWQGGTEYPRAQSVLSGKSNFMPIVDEKEFSAALEPEFVDLVDAFGVSSQIEVPIWLESRVIGRLEIIRVRNGASYTRDDLVLVQDLADRAALTIQNARLFEEIQEAQRRLQSLSSQLLVAQEQERRNIARELHDEIGQVMTAVSTDLQAVQHSRQPEMRAARLRDSIALVDDALSRVRDLSLDLRPAMLDDLGLVAALEWYIERQAERSGFEPAFVAEPPEMRLGPNLETTVFRVAQIALTNVARYAQAKHVSVELHRRDSKVEMVIRDDGVGFDVSSAFARAAQGESMGLLNMQERVRLAHGELEVKSRPEHGTEIRAWFPVSSKEMNDEQIKDSG